MKRFLVSAAAQSKNQSIKLGRNSTSFLTTPSLSFSHMMMVNNNNNHMFVQHEQQLSQFHHNRVHLQNESQQEESGEIEAPAKKRAARKQSTTAPKKRASSKKNESGLAENEREISDDELFEHKWQIQVEAKDLLTQENYNHAFPMLYEWYNFIHKPMSKREDVLSELYKRDLRHVLTDALLLGFFAQCYCVYEDKEQTKKAKPLFRKSFELLDQYMQRRAEIDRVGGEEAQKLSSFMDSDLERRGLNRTRGVLNTYAGFLWLKSDTYSTAEKYLLKAAAEDKESVFIFHRLAHYNRDRGDYTRAGKFYELAIQRMNNATLIGEYGSFLFSYPRKYEKAVEMFERALKLNPTHPDVLIAYASYYVQIEKFDKAIELLLRALHEKNIDPRPASMLGTVYVLMSQYEKARQAFTQAKSLGGYMSYKQTSHFAIAEYQCGNVNEAKNLFEQAFKLHDAEKPARQSAGEPVEDVTMLVRYAQLLFDSFKKYTDARLLLERAMAADPTFPDAHFLYALLMTKLQEFEKADEHFGILIAVEPNGDYVKGVLLKTHLAWYIDYLINDKKQPEAATPHIKRLLKLIQDFPNENQDSDMLEDLEEHKTAHPNLF